MGRRRLRRPLPRASRRRPIRRCCCRMPTRSRRWCCGSSDRRRSLPRASAKRPRARCSCPAAGPGMRTPLWQQRKRASDLLAVASRFGSFPALLETYREVLRDHFDMPALVDTLRQDFVARAARDDHRFARAVAVRGVAALQLRRQLHLRRRRAAGGAARAGALGRSGAAARAARRRRAARAARPGGARDGRSASCSISTRSTGSRRPTGFTIC